MHLESSCTTDALENLASEEIVAAVRPKRKSGTRGDKVEYEEAMISIKDCFTFLMPIVQQVVRASNKEIIERQDVMKKELLEKINENEKKNYEKMEAMRKELTFTRYQLDSHQQWSRRENLRIFGIDKTDDKEDCVQIARNIFEDMGVPVEKEEISVAHRLNSGRDSGRAGAIIVRFVSRTPRLKVIRKKKDLTTKPVCKRKYPDAFITDDTTPLRSAILYRLRQAKPEIQSSWSIDGRIYVKKQGESNEVKPHVINTPDDLVQKLNWSQQTVEELMEFKM